MSRFIVLAFVVFPLLSKAQQVGTTELPLQYVGEPKVADSDQHDGQLRPVVGVDNFQILRANRTHPPEDDQAGNTYNHAPMLAYWNNHFYVEYLAQEWQEHGGRTQTYLTSSEDGKHWTAPRLIFPAIEHRPGAFTIAHQRMGFYQAPDGKLLALAYYGIPLEPGGGPNKGNGLGRAVREIRQDGSVGPIYFIRYMPHAGYPQAKVTWYPFYQKSPDKAFVAACDALLANRLMTQQWWEEDQSQDGFFALGADTIINFEPKALSFFHRKDSTVVGLWKGAWAALSQDEGNSWSKPVIIKSKPEGSAKEWGQRTDDGRYAIVYNPQGGDPRLPLALITSNDGITFDSLRYVHGDVPELRYTGTFKDVGAEYVRGIAEGNGNPPGNDLWVVYSVNKEDIWISRVPIPARESVSGEVREDFENTTTGEVPDGWNVYKPYWATVETAEENGNHYLHLRNEEPYDYAKLVKVFPESKKLSVTFTLLDFRDGHLEIDVQDRYGHRPIRLGDFVSWNFLTATEGPVLRHLKRLENGQEYRFRLEVDVDQQQYDLYLNDEALLQAAPFREPVESLERLEFRTGAYRQRNKHRYDLLAPKDDGLPGADEKHHRISDYKIDNITIIVTEDVIVTEN